MVKRGRQPRLDLHTHFFSVLLECLTGASFEINARLWSRFTGLAAAGKSSSHGEQEKKKLKLELNGRGAACHTRARAEERSHTRARVRERSH